MNRGWTVLQLLAEAQTYLTHTVSGVDLRHARIFIPGLPEEFYRRHSGRSVKLSTHHNVSSDYVKLVSSTPTYAFVGWFLMPCRITSLTSIKHS
jgi:hypothetical protein